MRASSVLGLTFALFVAAVSCSTKEAGGTLMLGFSTDMEVPEDVTAVGVLVKNGDAVRLRSVTRVEKGADGRYKVRLPATLAVRGPAGTNAAVVIRILAFGKDGKPFVLRQAQATTPSTSRTALLKMPLLWMNRGQFTDNGVGTKAAAGLHLAAVNEAAQLLQLENSNDCDSDASRHRVNGVCTGVPFYDGDSVASLPDYKDDLFFGGPADADGKRPCFDAAACLTVPGLTVPPSLIAADCSFDVNGAVGEINVGIEPQEDAGICAQASTGTRCVVPLAKSEEGVIVTAADDKVHVQLPKGVCARGFRNLVVSRNCAPLLPGQVVCNHSDGDDTKRDAPPPLNPGQGGALFDDASIDASTDAPSVAQDAGFDAGKDVDGGDSGVITADGGISDGGDGGGPDQEPVGARTAGMGSVAFREQGAFTAFYTASIDSMGKGPYILRYPRAQFMGAGTATPGAPISAGSSMWGGAPFLVSAGQASSGANDLVAWTDPRTITAVTPASDLYRAANVVAATGVPTLFSIPSTIGDSYFGVGVAGVGVNDGVAFLRTSGPSRDPYTWAPYSDPTNVYLNTTPYDRATLGEPLNMVRDPDRTRAYPIFGTSKGAVLVYGTMAVTAVASPGGGPITALTFRAGSTDQLYFVVSNGGGMDKIYESSIAAAMATPVVTNLNLDCGFNTANALTAYPCGLAADSHHVYYVKSDNTIYTYPIDARPTPTEQVFTNIPATAIRGMVADEVGGYLYFTALTTSPTMPGQGGLWRKRLLP